MLDVDGCKYLTQQNDAHNAGVPVLHGVLRTYCTFFFFFMTGELVTQTACMLVSVAYRIENKASHYLYHACTYKVRRLRGVS